MRELATMVLFASLGGAQPIYDLLLKNGHVVDPKNQRNGSMDVAITGNKIAKVALNIPVTQAKMVVDATRYYVTPGMIDIQAHLRYFPAAGGGAQPDVNAIRIGVTTVVDAGSVGSKTFEEFKKDVIDRSQMRVLVFLNVAGDAEGAARVVRQYPNLIVGVESDGSSLEDVDRAVKASEASKTVAIVSLTSDRAGAEQILSRLRPGDIFTHVYGRAADPLDAKRQVRAGVLAARKRGVLFDAGHGGQGLWFRIAGPAIKQGFLPDTISSDMDASSLLLARTDMATTLSKLMNLGMTLEQVVERATVNPAKAIKRPELGTLSEGATADVAVFALEQGSFGFLDSGNARLAGDKKLRCAMTLRNGRVAWDEDGLSLIDWTKAGPYTNYK